MSSLKSNIKNILQKLGVDKAIAYSSGSKIINGSTGLITIAFISIFLTEEEQGFYYTFGSIIALQVFFELGLTNIITQFIAHENAYIDWDDNHIIGGIKAHISRLGHMLQFTKKWYVIISTIFLISILVGGIWFFNKYSLKADYHLWLWPWLLVTSATALNLFITPFLAILDGVGKIKDTSRIKFYQQLVIPIIMWTSFVLKGGLYVVGISQWCGVILTFVLIKNSHLWLLLKEINRIKITDKIDYRGEVFPYQWKIALSWASGYFVFQLFNPILFATSGPVVAGQMGMSLTAINGIASFATSWISTKIPKLSSLIAVKHYVELDKLFNTTMKQLSILCGVMLISLFGFVVILNYFHFPLASRFLGILPFALLEIAVFANQHGNGWATYLRCHKREPLLINSVVGAITCGLSTIFLGKYYGVMGMTLGYCILRVGLTAWNYTVYKRKKLLWHSR